MTGGGQVAVAAVVFDCDGTLADTEAIADRAWRQVLGVRGFVLSRNDTHAVRGRPWPAVFAHYLDRVPGLADEDPAEFRVELSDVFRGLFDREASLFADAMEVLDAAVEAGLAVGVCSSSSRNHLDHVRRLDARLERVAVWVGREDTDEHKPEPAPYLEAARRLGHDPARCVAFEDTPLGATSAVRAGMITVGVDRGDVPGAWPSEVRVVTRPRTWDVPGLRP